MERRRSSPSSRTATPVTRGGWRETQGAAPRTTSPPSVISPPSMVSPRMVADGQGRAPASQGSVWDAGAPASAPATAPPAVQQPQHPQLVWPKDMLEQRPSDSCNESSIEAAPTEDLGTAESSPARISPPRGDALAPNAGSVPVPPALSAPQQGGHLQFPPQPVHLGAGHGNVLPNWPQMETQSLGGRQLLEPPAEAAASDASTLRNATQQDVPTMLGQGSSPSTVDLHGSASVGSLRSGGAGQLEFSDTMSPHSWAVSSSSSHRQSPCDVPVGKGGAAASAAPLPGRRTPDVATRDLHRFSPSPSREAARSSPPSDRKLMDLGLNDVTVGSEHVPLEELLPTPRLFQALREKENGSGNDESKKLSGSQEISDPLAETVKAQATVTTMRTFWESQARKEAASSPKETVRPTRSSVDGARRRSTMSASGAASRRCHSAQRVRQDIAKAQRQLEGASELLAQLTHRIQGVETDSVLTARSPSSNSESDLQLDATREVDEDDDLAFMRAYRESSSALWKVQRQTVRLLLSHLDKAGVEYPGFGAALGAHLATGSPPPAGTLRAGGSPLLYSPVQRGPADGEAGEQAKPSPPTLLQGKNRVMGPSRKSLDLKCVEEPAREPDISALPIA